MNYFYLNGKFVSPNKANISIMTHAFNYGTAVIEGIRAYWNPVQKQLYVYRLEDHFRRMQKSCRPLKLALPREIKGMCQLTVELLRKNKVKQSVYIRPICFQARLGIAAKRAGDSGFAIFLLPLAASTQPPRPLRVLLSSWRRIDSRMIPSFAKITGTYVNSFLAGQEALQKGFDEAIMLNLDGTVAEATGMNVFMVKKGRIYTPPLSVNILAGITRDSVIRIAKKELKIEPIEKKIKPEEMKSAEEVFLTGTGSEVIPAGLIDGKKIGRGGTGPITDTLQSLYRVIVRGEKPRYKGWLTTVF